MIEIHEETMIRLSEIPAWHDTIFGRPVHSNTVRRWISDTGEVKLDSVLMGGVRYTSQEALQRFLNDCNGGGQQ